MEKVLIQYLSGSSDGSEEPDGQSRYSARRDVTDEVGLPVTVLGAVTAGPITIDATQLPLPVSVEAGEITINVDLGDIGDVIADFTGTQDEIVPHRVAVVDTTGIEIGTGDTAGDRNLNGATIANAYKYRQLWLSLESTDAAGLTLEVRHAKHASHSWRSLHSPVSLSPDGGGLIAYDAEYDTRSARYNFVLKTTSSTANVKIFLSGVTR